MEGGEKQEATSQEKVNNGDITISFAKKKVIAGVVVIILAVFIILLFAVIKPNYEKSIIDKARLEGAYAIAYEQSLSLGQNGINGEIFYIDQNNNISRTSLTNILNSIYQNQQNSTGF